MARVVFTPNLARHVTVPACEVTGDTVGACLEAVFGTHPQARGYVLDDQGSLRKHVVVFLNGLQVLDRRHLADPVAPGDELTVMQALSGG